MHNPNQTNTITIVRTNSLKWSESFILLPNVPSQESPLASGMASANSGWQMRGKGENGLPVSPSLGARAEATPEASGDS